MGKAGRSWPYQEAQKVVEELASRPPLDGKPVLFETGYGPSGLPHIGTFAEVARTTFLRHAFTALSGLPSKLVAYSDDMDGLRKVPKNIPNQERTAQYIGRPLSEIPDPFDEAESFSAYMNAKLRSFLDRFGFEYEFRSSTEQYRSGVFDAGLLRILEHYDDVRNVVLPTLSEENREGWSPFMPICSRCRRYTTRVLAVHPERGTLTYRCERSFGASLFQTEGCGHEEETPVTGGRVKAGWKVDWALRWYVLRHPLRDVRQGPDPQRRAVGPNRPTCSAAGRRRGFFYEMFLDEKGEKISKSVGQGLTVDTWLEYAPIESLAHFLLYNPRQARRLHVGIIPQEVDAYLKDLRAYPKLGERRSSTARPVHPSGTVPEPWGGTITFSLVQNLVACLSTEDEA